MLNKFCIIASLLILLVCSSCKPDPYEHITFNELEGENSISYTSSYELKDGKALIRNSYFKPYQYEKADGEIRSYIFAIQESINELTNDYTIKIAPTHSNESIANWEIISKASQYDFIKNLVVLEHTPQENEEVLFEVYNAATGQKLMNYTYGMLDAFFPDGIEKRMFGFQSTKTKSGLTYADNDALLLGYFTYASDQNAKQLFVLKAKNAMVLDSLDKSTPVMKFLPDELGNHLILNNGKGLYLSGETTEGAILKFNIETTFYFGAKYEETPILFPIWNDEIDIREMEYNRNYFDIEVLDL